MATFRHTTPEDIGKIYRKRFMAGELPPYHAMPGESIYGSTYKHCEVCPEREGERCVRTCSQVREDLRAEDGVTVAMTAAL